MYKLFLTFRYLTRKKIVLFPILVVWLCVMMLIIVTSIMGGFVERVRSANRDLFGDIIISSGSATRGFANYDQLAEMLKKEFPQIGVVTPTVELYGLIFVPSAGQTRPMQLVGIKPEERAKVSKFRESLFLQYKAPAQAMADLSPHLPASRDQLIAFARKHAGEARKKEEDALKAKWDLDIKYMNDQAAGIPLRPRPDFRWLAGFAVVAIIVAGLVLRARMQRSGWGMFTAAVVGLFLTAIVFAGLYWPVMFPRDFALAEDSAKRAALDNVNAQQTLRLAESLPEREYKTSADLSAALAPPVPSFKVPPEAGSVREERQLQGIREGELSPDGVVVGSQIGFFERDMRGNFLHPVTPRYQAVTITVFPASQKTGNINVSKENAVSHNFTIVDDSHTGVYDVDSYNVYAPFERVQEMAGMRISEEDRKAGVAEFPPLCHEMLIKLSTDMSASDMRRIRARMEQFIERYQEDRAQQQRILEPPLRVETWDEKQAKYLGAVQNEKVMMTFILGLMSMVVLVVIFLIFYQIVRDKTRDIGIIKAVGGSEEGVAGIFLTYGLFIGLVGGVLGLLTGTLFVTHTNEIHEWIYRMTGVVIWDRSVYLFDRIPDVVNPWDCVTYFTVALAAGLLGALIPAIVAGAEDPVQAVRYE